ncbi:hypothetical protein COOONC_00528 [Cooperia oncophora]
MKNYLLKVVRLERDHHSREVGAALSRLAGIESALNSRVALDSENRRAKQFWIACHSLVDSIQHGIKAGEDMEKRRSPLEDSLRLLEQFTENITGQIMPGPLTSSQL